ncbi:hypothetical protein BDP27DRAFT_1324716 [Rhodocollybia butyracea]|uniref:Uncharacterized protein n=1 Tax=Rhodocollybia butyracea TaxID=206335 RepID=A0A9P5U8F3_9AGAR|nr:hypothetical protein BDP27DRAFT_1324716 [Rhodocollybia butyracea]
MITVSTDEKHHSDPEIDYIGYDSQLSSSPLRDCHPTRYGNLLTPTRDGFSRYLSTHASKIREEAPYGTLNVSESGLAWGSKETHIEAVHYPHAAFPVPGDNLFESPQDLQGSIDEAFIQTTDNFQGPVRDASYLPLSPPTSGLSQQVVKDATIPLNLQSVSRRYPGTRRLLRKDGKKCTT